MELGEHARIDRNVLSGKKQTTAFAFFWLNPVTFEMQSILTDRHTSSISVAAGFGRFRAARGLGGALISGGGDGGGADDSELLTSD